MRKPIEYRLYRFLNMVLQQTEYSEEWLNANKEELHVPTTFEFMSTLFTKLNITLNNNGAGYLKVVFWWHCTIVI